VPESISIPRRFNGPLDSGQGGYSAGIAAGFLEGAAEVSLRRPVPLDSPLAVEREGGGSLRVLDGGEVVMEARAVADVGAEPPAPVSPSEARQASARWRKPDERFSHCFVCGRSREDGFGVFAGEVEGRRLVASPWTPPPWTADEAGHARPEFVWAVLDCPTFFAVYLGEELRVSFLAGLGARLSRPVVAGEEHVVVSWPLEVEARKRHAGAAVLSPEGEALAVARALMIEPRR
jgi:hypothetical protein